MKKSNNLLVLCILLAVITIALGGYIAYDKLIGLNNDQSSDSSSIDNTKLTNNNEETEESINDNNILITDYSNNKLKAYLDNGILYYQTNDGEIKTYAAVTSIKKIKAFSYGTSVRKELFLITESGKVYSTIDLYDNELNFTETDIFKNYEVENITSKKGEVKEEFEVLLKSGKTIIITRSMDN